MDDNGGNYEDDFVAHTKSLNVKILEDLVEECDLFIRSSVVEREQEKILH